MHPPTLVTTFLLQILKDTGNSMKEQVHPFLMPVEMAILELLTEQLGNGEELKVL